MRYMIRLLAVVATMATALLGTPAVLAQADEGEGGQHAVFVLTNDPNANSIATYAQNENGTLTYVASYPTGGKGGRAAGAVVDPLASQQALVYDREHRLLLAPNAGSDTVSVFSVRGARLHLNQIVASGGPFPASIAVHENVAYVLDAGLAGYVQGYRIAGGTLHPIAGSQRSLNLANTNPPGFLQSPGQVGFSPDGNKLVITTKGNAGGAVDVFNVLDDGQLSTAPTATAVGGVAFAFAFDSEGRLVIVNAAFGNLSTFDVKGNGSLSLVSAGASSGQKGACWVAAADGNFYTGNTGSANLSQYTIDENGTVVLSNPQAAIGIPGAIDMAVSREGHFLYAQSGGSGSVKAFAVSEDGSLLPIGSWTVPDGGSQEGIAAA
jgi:6-phosphogluconolactonase (cycloisomerase 2 family)